MKDPYEVLGVAQTASDSEIKKAYHELVKKYHPDNYANNPLADLASEKMKEINEAYDTITRARAGGSSGGYQSGGSSGGYQSGGYGGGYQGGYQSSYGRSGYQSGYSGADYSQVRAYINNGRLDQAESILNGMNGKDSEWYYLRGMIAYRRGWLDEARQNFQIASNMTPGNLEYQNALRTVQGSYTPYRSSNFQNGSMDAACDMCNMLLCLNCLCGGCGR